MITEFHETLDGKYLYAVRSDDDRFLNVSYTIYGSGVNRLIEIHNDPYLNDMDWCDGGEEPIDINSNEAPHATIVASISGGSAGNPTMTIEIHPHFMRGIAKKAFGIE